MPAMAHWGQLQYGIWVDKNKTTRTFVEFLADMYVKQVGYFHIQFFLCEYSQKMAQRVPNGSLFKILFLFIIR